MARGSAKFFRPRAEEAGMATTAAHALGLQGTLLIQLNLNQGALEPGQRRGVITRCYRPLLQLLDGRPWLRLALAASGHTLERAARLEPGWVTALREGIDSGQIEFLGMGDTQLVGPLVPAAVNRWNQELGRETYLRLLGVSPRVALVNELAWSQGLVDAYLDAGYEALVGEWSCTRTFHPEWREEWCRRAVWTESPSGRRIRLLWTEHVVRDGFLGALRDETEPERFAEAVLERAGPRPGHVFVPAGEAEAFDPQVGRTSNAAGGLPSREWQRMGALCDLLHGRGLEFAAPSSVLDDPRLASDVSLDLTLAQHPIALGRPAQRVTGWALAGWDNPGVNARCFARAKELERVGATAGDWRLLCRAWGSDLRADLSERRWRRFEASLPARPGGALLDSAFTEAPLRTRRVERGGRRLAVGTEGVRVVLDLRRGLAVDSLCLLRAGPAALLGTQRPGARGSGAIEPDCTSGHAVLEYPSGRRVTDLQAAEPEIEDRTRCVLVRARIQTELGTLRKEVRVHAQRLVILYRFSDLGLRPAARLRAGALTLFDASFGETLWVSCANGGARERLRLDPDVREAVFGATDGWIALDDGQVGFEVSWPQEEAPALPVVTALREGERRLVRLEFTLNEVDTTFRPGAELRDFRLSIRPYRNRR